MLHTVSVENWVVKIPKSGKKMFKPNVTISQEQFDKCLEFASRMAYWDKHNSLAFGSTTYNRNQWNVFKNALQWKLAEVGFYNFYTNKWVILTKPDFWVWERWVWEDCDVVINSKKISIKSTKHIWNLLLLEKDRYSQDWLYLEPANWDIPIKHDLIYFVRVKWIDSDNPEYYKNIRNIELEITWYITYEDFIKIIRDNMIIKKWNILWIEMIVDNYYICSWDLNSVML